MKQFFDHISTLVQKYQTALLFLVSGGSAALFQLCLYVFLSRILDLTYLVASNSSFVTTVVFSFLLQKYVTFRHKETKAIPKQFLFFALLACFNLYANTQLMVLFVEKISIHDVVAQILTMGTIAVWSFFVYRNGIFKQASL